MGLSAFKGAVPKVPDEDHQPSFSYPVTTAVQQEQEQEQENNPSATGAGADTGAGITRSKTEAEKAADREYEERIEDEYAKRDGGA